MQKPAKSTANGVSRPSTDDPAAWRNYWRHVGQPWRREPEIGQQRQGYLAMLYRNSNPRRSSQPPFQGVILHRADIEWLLYFRSSARNYSGTAGVPVLDLRGAIIRANLTGLDLTKLPPRDPEIVTTSAELEVRTAQGVLRTQSEPVTLLEPPAAEQLHASDAVADETALSSEVTVPAAPIEAKPVDPEIVERLKAAYEAGERDFTGWYLAGADLRGVNLRLSRLQDVNFCNALLVDADLSHCSLQSAQLIGADLSGARLFRAKLRYTKAKGVILRNADLSGAIIEFADLTEADLRGANLERTEFHDTHVTGAIVAGAQGDAQTMQHLQYGITWRPAMKKDEPSAWPVYKRLSGVVGPEDYVGSWWSRDLDA